MGISWRRTAKLKTGIVTPGFSANEDDWCIPAQLNLVRRLSREAEVQVFPLRYPHHRRPYTVYDAVVHPQGGADTGGLGRVPLLLRTLRSVVKEHRRRPFDVLHAMWADEPGFVAVTAGRLLGVPTSVSLLGGELVGFRDIGYGVQCSVVGRQLVRIALRGATRVLAGSTYLRRLARPHVTVNRLLSIPIGVDTARFRRDVAPLADFPEAGEINLLHAGSLVPVKDQAMLLRAMARVVQQMTGVRLHIAGDGPLGDDLRGLAESLDIGDHVTFHGAVRHERMPAHYRAADLCVLSSRHEGQELVALEAAACNCATVGTAVGLLPDLMPATHVVPVGDDNALAEALLHALQDRHTLRAVGQAGRVTVEANYTLERTVACLLSLYQGLA